jgi:uncharacterized membrane protein
MFCQYCGTSCSPELKFCPQCGKEQPGAAAPVNTPAVTPPPFVPPAVIQARSGDWIGQGWDLVKAELGGFVLITVLSLLLNSVIPLILHGPLMAGTYIYCVMRLTRGRAEVGDLFKGFNYFIPAFVGGLLISIFTFLASLLLIIPGLIVAAMYSFTYLFIIDKKMDFWPAMQASHAIVKNDYLGFTLFIVLLGLIQILGALCCLVGLLVTIPLIAAATTVAYRDLVGLEPNAQY